MQEFQGRFYVGNSLDDLSIGSDAISLTQGYYYFSGYGSEEQFCEHLQAMIRAIGASQDATTVSYSLATGRLTITLETAATLTFTDPASAALLGFTGDQSSASVHTATQTPRFNWRPSESLTQMPGNASNIFLPRSNTIGGRGPDGTTFGTVGSIVYDASELRWDLLDEKYVLKPRTGTVGDDLESWFEDVVHEDQPFRIITDTDAYADTDDFVTCKWGKDAMERVGSFGDYIIRERDDYQGFWNVSIPVMKHVEAS